MSSVEREETKERAVRGGGSGGARRVRAAILSSGIAFAACLAVLVSTPGDSYWINDCGNKALVAKRLLETGYRDLGFDYPAAAVDPLRGAFPIAPPFAVARGRGFISTYPPAYAATAAPFLAVFGPVGLRVPAALGVAACAGLLSLWLAAAVGSLWAFTAGVVLALATPLFFYGITVWEHSLTVALCLGAWLLASREAPARLFAAGWLVASACWLREELALMGIALAVACVVRWRRPAALPWLLAGAALPSGALLLTNQLIYDTPLGVHLLASAGTGAAASGMPEGATVGSARVLASLLAGYGKGAFEPTLLGAVALAVLAPGGLAAQENATLQQARQAYENPEYEQAAAMAQRALREGLTTAEAIAAWEITAYSHANMGNQDRAIEAFVELIYLDPRREPDAEQIAPRILNAWTTALGSVLVVRDVTIEQREFVAGEGRVLRWCRRGSQPSPRLREHGGALQQQRNELREVPLLRRGLPRGELPGAGKERPRRG